MTPRGRFIFAPAAKAFMKRRNDVSNAFGSSMRKTRLNVSWLGKPFLSTSTSCQRYAFIRANSAMSVQVVAPHSVASNAMNKISIVQRILRARVGQVCKALAKSSHRRLPPNQKPPSESTFPSLAMTYKSPHAIPLVPTGGQVPPSVAAQRYLRSHANDEHQI